MRYDIGKLKRGRMIRAMSARQLAEAVDIHPDTILRLESGKGNPHPETIKKVADFLGVPMGDLITEDEPNVS
jgi:transcriptional regulator with XRE-family HTH domain